MPTPLRSLRHQQIKNDEVAAVQKALASKEGEAKLSGMNKAQMPSFGNAAFTFMLGVLNDKQLADGISALLSTRQWLPMLTAKKTRTASGRAGPPCLGT